MFVVCTGLKRLCELFATKCLISRLLFLSLWGLKKESTISPQYASVRAAASRGVVRLLLPAIPSSHSGSAQLYLDEEMGFSGIPSHTHIFLFCCISSGSLRLWHWFPNQQAFLFSVFC